MRAGQDEAEGRAQPLAGIQQSLVGAHLLLLARLLRKSAKSDYHGLQPENQIERRIILTLVRLKGGRVSELAAFLGSDVGQVSRALSSLNSQSLLIRERPHAPYRLSNSGVAVGQALDAVALRRDQNLMLGITSLEAYELGGILADLAKRAADIFAEETASFNEGDEFHGMGGSRQPTIEIFSRVSPAIFSLSTVIARTANLTFKRLTGLSQYEWRVLTNLAYRPPLSFTEVVEHVDSDKAQVSRALDHLVKRGALVREKVTRGEPARFRMTGEGRAIHDVLQDDALRRNGLLIAGLNPDQQIRCLSYLERLIANASE